MTIMKKKGCIKLFRWELTREGQLTDAELRLYLLFRRLVDWDKRHEHFGAVKISIRELHSQHLNFTGWSVTKISVTLNSLIKKGFLKRSTDRYIHVENFRIFHAKVPVAERMFLLLEQGVQPTEQDVLQAERTDPNDIYRRRRELAQKFKIP